MSRPSLVAVLILLLAGCSSSMRTASEVEAGDRGNVASQSVDGVDHRNTSWEMPAIKDADKLQLIMFFTVPAGGYPIAMPLRELPVGEEMHAAVGGTSRFGHGGMTFAGTTGWSVSRPNESTLVVSVNISSGGSIGKPDKTSSDREEITIVAGRAAMLTFANHPDCYVFCAIVPVEAPAE